MKETEKKTVVLSAELIQENLKSEFDLFIATLPSAAKRAALDSDLIKIESLFSTQREKVKECEQEIASLEGKIKAASVEDLPGFSKQKAKIISAREESNVLLKDLTARKNDITAAMENISQSAHGDIRRFLREKTETLAKEIETRLQIEVELIKAWQSFIMDSAVRRAGGFNVTDMFWVNYEIKIYAPVVEAACHNVMTPRK